jgi:UDP-2-acetamido-2,6-beta-L-arabino-hexul-4-ose reductase
MVAIALTGANGFLGWHTRCAARACGQSSAGIAVGKAFDLREATTTINGADRVVHIAGVNRAADSEVRAGNVLFAEQIAAALSGAATAPATVVFANSVQAGNGTSYGESKAAAAEILKRAAASVGAAFIDVRLPNLFGEHGRPFYNSVVATFCHQLARRQVPSVDSDRELVLLHAQHAADALLGVTDPRYLHSLTATALVSDLLQKLTDLASTYERAEIPDISKPFDRDLFNTYRSTSFEIRPTTLLNANTDRRGSFFEVVRCHGGTGQASFSTTASGVTRGDHFHRRKVERFVVLSGEALISLRRLFRSEVHEIRVSGEQPTLVDMPTMWAHNITNVGNSDLFTSFWSNEIFDPENPDTVAEAV